MASMDQLETALRNADAAGDSNAAKMLAGELIKMRSATSSQPGIMSEIGGDVTSAVKSAAKSVGDYLNPFSEARHASYAKQAAAPLGEALTENLRQIGGTGAALATPVTAPGAVAGAVATPLVARPFQELNKAVGVNIPYEQAKEQAGTALMGLAPKGFSPVGARMTAAPLPSPTELKGAGKAVYNDPAIKSIQLNPNDVSALSQQIHGELVNRGYRPTPGSAPSTLPEIENLDPLRQAQSGSANKVGINAVSKALNPVGVDDIRAARRALNMTAKQVGQDFKPTPDAEAARHAIGRIDDFLDTVDPRLREANANYSAGRRAETMDYRQMKAEHRADKSGTGKNLENTMRQEVDKISNRGLTQKEIALRDKIVRGTFTRNRLREAGKIGFGDAIPTMYHLAAAAPSGGISTAAGVAGTVARKVGEALTRAQIKHLSETTRSRTPLAQSRLMIAPHLSNKAKIAALLAARLNAPGFSSMTPAYADQDQ